MDVDIDAARATADADCALLAAHGLRPCPALGSIICINTETCGGEISNCRKAMRHHLTKYHGLSGSIVASLWLAASRLSAEFPATHPLREKYKSGGGSHGCLPKINGLPIVWCKECPTCSRMFPSEEGLRRHCSKKHEGISRNEVRALGLVPCQALGSRRANGAPFRVALEDAAAPSPEEEGAVTAALSSYEPGNVAGTPTLPSTDRELSSFVSLAKCCGRLEAHGLTLEQAAALISAPNRRSEAELCSVLAGLLGIFGEARDMCSELGSFRHFSHVHLDVRCLREKETISLSCK